MIYAIIFTLVSVSAWIWFDVASKLNEMKQRDRAIKSLEDSMNRTYEEFKKEFKPKTRKSRKTKEQI